MFEESTDDKRFKRLGMLNEFKEDEYAGMKRRSKNGMNWRKSKQTICETKH